MWSQAINCLLGIAVMIVPGLVGFEEIAANNNYITGPLIFTFALTAVTDAARNLRLVNIASGIWLILSPFVLGFDGSAQLWNIVLGVLVIIFSFPRGKVEHRFGGGWRSLFEKEPEHVKVARLIREKKGIEPANRMGA